MVAERFLVDILSSVWFGKGQSSRLDAISVVTVRRSCFLVLMIIAAEVGLLDGMGGDFMPACRYCGARVYSPT